MVTFGDYTFDDVTDVIVNLREFLFADDAAFIALSEVNMQRVITVVDETCVAFGMELSKTKAEV